LPWPASKLKPIRPSLAAFCGQIETGANP